MSSKKNKVQQFRKRSREHKGGKGGDDHYGPGGGSDADSDSWSHKPSAGPDGRHRGSYNYDQLKLTEEFKARIELQGPKRKYAVCFGYLGTNYQGLQINPDCKSVEAELERALFLAGAVQDCNYGNLHKLQWSRAARTDRGVHAVGQCCAMKLCFPVADRTKLIASVNSFLPGDIRVLAMTKVTKNFNSKLTCSQRRYHYLLPTYLVSDAAHVTALLTAAMDRQGPLKDCGRVGGYAEPGASYFLGAEGLQAVRESLSERFRISTEQLSRLRSALAAFQGTRSFHNYTTGKKSDDASARRYIVSFDCGEPIVHSDGVEWVLLSVVGQSFLLNQIRKMVGMALEVARGAASLDNLLWTLTDRRADIPMVPGLGLYLDELFFEQYNFKQEREKEKMQTVLRVRALKAAGGRPSSETLRESAIKAVELAQNQEIAVSVHSLQGISADHVAVDDHVVPPSEDLPASGDSEVQKRMKTEEGDFGIEAMKSNHCEEDAGSADGQGGSVQTATAAGEEDDEEQSAEVMLGEPIMWSKDPTTQAAMVQFRDEVIWPHIRIEEERGLHFMYYLDFLRVKPFKYGLIAPAGGESL